MAAADVEMTSGLNPGAPDSAAANPLTSGGGGAADASGERFMTLTRQHPSQSQADVSIFRGRADTLTRSRVTPMSDGSNRNLEVGSGGGGRDRSGSHFFNTIGDGSRHEVRGRRRSVTAAASKKLGIDSKDLRPQAKRVSMRHGDVPGGDSEHSGFLPGHEDFYQSELRTDPFKLVDRLWRNVLIVLFIALEVCFIPDPYDVGACPAGTNLRARPSPANLVSRTTDLHAGGDEDPRDCYVANGTTAPFDFTAGKPYCGWENAWFLQAGHLREPAPNLCTRNWVSYGFLVVSHSMGAVLYISLSVVMLTRMRFFLSLAQCTSLGEWLPFHAMQEIHNKAGYVTLYAVVTHMVFHLLRYSSNGDIEMFYGDASISGYVCITIMLFIIGGMARSVLLKISGVNLLMGNAQVARGKKQPLPTSWEFKWVVHMMWVWFSIAMFYHRYRFGVYWVVILIMFALDRTLERCVMTFKALDVELLPCGKHGVMIRFAYQRRSTLAPDVELAGSIVRICMPHISKHQYHPFSAFYDPYDARFACVYIAKAGDWTTQLYNYSLCHHTMPWAWVAGPLYSEFQSALEFRDIVLVCSGAAITPIMGLSQYFDPDVHKVTLLWVTRAHDLISSLLPVCNPATRIIVYYTGKDKPQEKVEEIKEQKFFAAPKLNQKQRVKIVQMNMSNGTGGNADGSGLAEDVEVRFGRPRDWNTILDEHITPNMRGETCVAVSTGVKRLADEVVGLCNQKGIAHIRSDASFD